MIVINDTYFVVPDSYNYILKRNGTGTNKAGETIETTRIVGYYCSLQNAIIGASEDCKRNEFSKKDYSLEEALVKIQEINDEFTEILRKSIKEVEEIKHG